MGNVNDREQVFNVTAASQVQQNQESEEECEIVAPSEFLMMMGQVPSPSPRPTHSPFMFTPQVTNFPSSLSFFHFFTIQE
ncbi:hypothetical protein Lalb_Chr18g0057271 [Lupinus albus]|uniref:Uncharacterized protein n=1 Tax=Lupinus albus TaxID=3870 RepID=A0A6A4P7M8_LUPAL|nr:hypothetical protein Lalb_Chr18g0057271 [Lupinus albus]